MGSLHVVTRSLETLQPLALLLNQYPVLEQGQANTKEVLTLHQPNDKIFDNKPQKQSEPEYNVPFDLYSKVINVSKSFVATNLIDIYNH